MSTDPLIDSEWGILTLLLSFVLFTILVLIVGFISRGLENAIFFTLIASGSIFLAFLLTYL